MAISLVGKLAILCITLAVIGGMTAVIVLVVNEDAETAVPEAPVAPAPPSPAPIEPPTEPPTEPGVESDLPYNVGVGIADMTGPAVEITFMGYAELNQRGTGIHLRQFSRAFIFEKDGSRVVLVTAEVQSIGIAVRREVVKNLQELYGETYSLRNVILTATHTHSTPGGYLVDFLLDISILGFSEETFDAYVAGITRSIVRAHENMVPARLFFSQIEVQDANMNRSPFSYQNNPPEELARYLSDSDHILSQVRIETASGELHGVMNWFPVHTTSMNMTNQHISSDNLGAAALFMEEALNPYDPIGKPSIVAGFFSSNLGDVSPNTRGARCEFSGEECDNQFLICGAGERCYSLGPGEDMFQSTKIIGTTIYEKAMELLSYPGEELSGELAVVHQFLEMEQEVASRYDPVLRTFNVSDPVRGCAPAMGYSFASGTIDGANTLNITQGTIVGNPLLDTISGVLASPTDEDIECHAPKPILLATGRANFPVPWHPHIVSASLIWLGDLVIAGVPGEPTTMAGRRIRDVVGARMEDGGFESRVVVSGLTNEYMHYVATFEEYQIQRYEAASTIYGPNTLDIFLNKFAEFTTAAMEGSSVPAGPEPADSRSSTISLISSVVLDAAGLGRSWGDVITQPPSSVQRGDYVTVTFVAANPRNDLKQEETHAAVQRLELGQWITVATDAHWDTLFTWERLSTLLGTSSAEFQWKVPSDALLVPHRMVYYGAYRTILGTINQFTAESEPFDIVDG